MQKFFKKSTAVIAILVILIGVGAGTVSASNNTLPGDALYPIKVNVTEKIQASFKTSDEAKAEWAIERIHRRIDELQRLAEMLDTIDPEILKHTQTQIDGYTEEVVESTKEMKRQQAETALAEVIESLNKASQSFEVFKEALADTSAIEELKNTLPVVMDDVAEVSEPVSETQEPNDTVDEHTDNTPEPVVHITVVDNVLPSKIYASEHANKSILFGKVKIRSNKDIKFGNAKLGCKGDTRVISGIFVSDNAGYTVLPGRTPTYGGFETSIFPYNANKPYIIRAGEEREISFQFGIKDPSWANDKGPYPVDISCGYKSISFTDMETGKTVPFGNYRITNVPEALKGMQTTLYK